MKLRAKLVGDNFRIADVVAKYRQDFKDVVADSSMRVEANAKRNVKVDTGRLRADIHIRFDDDGLAASVGTDVFYGPFVEFGTGRRGSATGNVPQGVNYTYGPRPGMPASPFLFPALEQERPTFESNSKAILGRKGKRK